MTARDVGGTTDRNSLSARQADGASMLVEVDAVAVLLLVRLIAEGPPQNLPLAWAPIVDSGAGAHPSLCERAD